LKVTTNAKRVLAALITVLLVACAVGALYAVPPEAPASTRVPPPLALETRRVKPGEVVIPVYSQGRVRAARRIPLSLEVAGRVVDTAAAFADGGRVAKGDLLLRLDPEPFDLQVTRRQNDVGAAELHLARTRAQARVARGRNSTATPLSRHEPQLEEAAGRLAAARAGLREARRQREQATLEAPFGGVLADVQVETGQHLPAGQTLAHLSGLDRMEVRLPVRDDWLGLLGIKPGQEDSLDSVTVNLSGRFAGFEGHWRGRVARREGGLNRNQMAYLVVIVNNSDQTLPLEPGVFVRAKLSGPARDGVAVLPREALADDDAVWVLDDEQRVRRRTVTIVHRDAEHLYIAQPFTRPVVLAGDRPLLDGMRITPLPDAAAGVARAEAEAP